MKNNYSISQNFLTNTHQVRKLIELTSLDQNTTVLDIGAGKGIISKVLIEKGYKVIAYEIDKVLYEYLLNNFEKNPNISILNKDFLLENLEKLGKFNIFSNIPFSLSSQIITKILIDKPIGSNINLVLQEETASRILGIKEGLLISLLVLNNYQPKIVYKFKKTDFSPSPKVNIVLMQFIKRKESLVKKEHQMYFLNFICFIVLQQKPTIEDRLKKILSDKQIQIMLSRLKIDYTASLYALDKLKYFEMFDYFWNNFKDNLLLTNGSYNKYQEINQKNNKNYKTRIK